LCGAVPDQRVKISEHGESDRASLFERLPTFARDVVAFNFDRRGARFHHFCHDRRERGEYKPCQHFTPKPVGNYQRFGGAVRTICEQQ
jgi:hypothetical protein